jgi:hypothetical protein
MRNCHCIMFGILLILVAASPACAQHHPGKFGMGLTVSGSAPGFIFSLRALPSLLCEPTFSLDLLNADQHNQRRFDPGLGILYQFRQGNDLRPIAGVRFGFHILRTQLIFYDPYPQYSPYYYGRMVTYTDFFCGPVFGARYYLSDNFAVSGEFQVTALFYDKGNAPSDDRGVGDMTVSTSQLLALYLYF